MSDEPYTVLFLSQRNSARSVIAAALLNQLGGGRFRAFSAGVRPTQAYDPIALELLEHAHVPRPDGAPQHYRAFAAADAPPLDFVFTLSDTAAGEPLPTWPGHPVTGHWSSVDPAQFPNSEAERRRSLIRTRSQLERRLRIFANLPHESLDRLSLQMQVDEIGRSEHDGAPHGPGTRGSEKSGSAGARTQ
jgi:protein-tyrosine-phosphatase